MSEKEEKGKEERIKVDIPNIHSFQTLFFVMNNRWSETNKDFQQLQKIFYSRVQGGPSPLRVIKCPVSILFFNFFFVVVLLYAADL